MFTEREQEYIIDALTMAIKSNARQQASKPQYSTVTKMIDNDLQLLLTKVRQIQPTKK